MVETLRSTPSNIDLKIKTMTNILLIPTKKSLTSRLTKDLTAVNSTTLRTISPKDRSRIKVVIQRNMLRLEEMLSAWKNQGWAKWREDLFPGWNKKEPMCLEIIIMITVSSKKARMFQTSIWPDRSWKCKKLRNILQGQGKLCSRKICSSLLNLSQWKFQDIPR